MFTRIRKIAILFIALLSGLQQIKAEFYNSALSVDTTTINDKDSTVVKKYELAKIFYEQDKHAKALKKALSLINKDNNLEMDIKLNLLVGKILSKDTSNINAYGYLKKSLYLLKKSKKTEIINIEKHNLLLVENYHELSKFFLHNDKQDSAKYYYSKLIELPEVDNRVMEFISYAYMNLGKIYAFEKDFEKAEKYTLEAIRINNLLKDDISISISYNNLANLYLERGKYKKGKEIYDKALTYLDNKKSLEAMNSKEMLLDNIAWTLYNLKDYKAYEFVTKSHDIRDSLNVDKLRKDLAKINAVHNVDIVKKEEENKRLKAEKKTWAVGIAGVIVSLLFLYIANLAKLRQRNLSLEYSQNELQQQKKLEQLKSQSQVKIINATIDGKETERKQIAEILHDNVSALLSSANMHLEASCKQFDGSIPLELQKTQQIIAEASEKIRDLSHNLMSSVLLKFGLEYAIKDVAKKFSNSDIKINTAIHNVYRYSQEFEIKTFNIIQELVNNILKHSNAKNAYIMMEEEYNNLAIIVKDDGEGFDNKTEEDKGIGLNQIEARIHMMNGTFLIESVKGEGTKASIRMPVVRRPKMHTA